MEAMQLCYKRNGKGISQKIYRNFKNGCLAEHIWENPCGGVCYKIAGIGFSLQLYWKEASTKEVFLKIHPNFKHFLRKV